MSLQIKAPGSELDFPISWTLAAAETISTSAWAVSPAEASGLAVKPGTPAVAGLVTSCIVTGGVFGRVYQLTNTITTNQGRTLSRTIGFRIGPVEAL